MPCLADLFSNYPYEGMMQWAIIQNALIGANIYRPDNGEVFMACVHGNNRGHVTAEYALFLRPSLTAKLVHTA
jgi:hypothetical protein